MRDEGHEQRGTPNPWTQDLQGKEDKDLGPDLHVVVGRIDTEGLKCGQKHEDSGPPVPHGEGQVHEQFIGDGLGGVVLLDDVVDLGDGRGDQKGEDESDDIMMVGPNGNGDRIEDGEERESPGDAVNHDPLCVGGGELVDDGAEEEEVDDGPGEEGPFGWGEVRLLDGAV